MDVALDDPSRTSLSSLLLGIRLKLFPLGKPCCVTCSTLTSAERGEGFTANYGFNTYDEPPLQHEMRKENGAKWKDLPWVARQCDFGEAWKTGEKTQEQGETLFLEILQNLVAKAGEGAPCACPPGCAGRKGVGRETQSPRVVLCSLSESLKL